MVAVEEAWEAYSSVVWREAASSITDPQRPGRATIDQAAERIVQMRRQSDEVRKIEGRKREGITE
jgi:hypothetical protein